jgi:hypothetical protein
VPAWQCPARLSPGQGLPVPRSEPAGESVSDTQGQPGGDSEPARPGPGPGEGWRGLSAAGLLLFHAESSIGLSHDPETLRAESFKLAGPRSRTRSHGSTGKSHRHSLQIGFRVARSRPGRPGPGSRASPGVQSPTITLSRKTRPVAARSCSRRRSCRRRRSCSCRRRWRRRRPGRPMGGVTVRRTMGGGHGRPARDSD